MTGLSATDSDWLASFFTTPAMREVFSDRARLQGMLDFEAALAGSEGDLGIIPAEAAAAIAAACDAGRYDTAELGPQAAFAGTLAVPMVKALTRAAGEAGRYVHWGATSQDAVDTGMVLQIRAGLALVSREVARLGDALAVLADRHRATAMAGRTFLQHALVTSFGLKAAGWLDAMTRHRERLAEIEPRVLVVSLGGAVGTLASLQPRGVAVVEGVAQRLGLAAPALPWHSHRDRFAELAALLAIVAGSCGKVAIDVALLMQTEVGEAAEPAAPGKGGSSAMPHKRNPSGAAAVIGAVRMAQALLPVMMQSLLQEQERGIGGWPAEWGTLAQSFALTHGALSGIAGIAQGLDVDAARMARNLDMTGGLLFTDGVVMKLAPHLGREAAYERVQALVKRAGAEGRSFREVVAEDETVLATLSASERAGLFDPQAALGAADELIDRALGAWRRGPGTPDAR